MTIYLPSAGGGQVPLSAIAQSRTAQRAAGDRSPGAIPCRDDLLRRSAKRILGCGRRLRCAQAEARGRDCPPEITTNFQGAALAFQSALGNELLLILAAVVTVYIVLGVLYESFIHPVTILSTLPSAGVGALLALLISGHDLDIIAIIGIILLIGIVKKNAIMMIDFALVAEREAREAAARGDPSGGAAALPAHSDDHGFGDIRGAAADARRRYGCGTAPPARYRHRRRPLGQPAAYPVHNAGDLFFISTG